MAATPHCHLPPKQRQTTSTMLSQEDKHDIAAYYKQKPNFVELWEKYHPSSETAAKQTTSNTTTMPVHPKEEEATGSK